MFFLLNHLPLWLELCRIDARMVRLIKTCKTFYEFLMHNDENRKFVFDALFQVSSFHEMKHYTHISWNCKSPHFVAGSVEIVFRKSRFADNNGRLCLTYKMDVLNDVLVQYGRSGLNHFAIHHYENCIRENEFTVDSQYKIKARGPPESKNIRRSIEAHSMFYFRVLNEYLIFEELPFWAKDLSQWKLVLPMFK